jgi:ATP-dependent Clp protease ATP-binding subunit ClpC
MEPDALLREAEEALAGVDGGTTVVRRYRYEASPLVRDARGWRTGRLDRVLTGDFNVIGAA